MSRRVEAVYEKGVFRPLVPPDGIPEHGHVVLIVAVEEPSSSLADLAASLSANDAEEMRGIVERSSGASILMTGVSTRPLSVVLSRNRR